MDAYDIFKKLSRGAKFKTKRPAHFRQNSVKVKKIKLENENKEDIEDKEENIVIKEDPIEFKEFEDNIEDKEENIVIKGDPIEYKEFEDNIVIKKDPNEYKEFEDNIVIKEEPIAYDAFEEKIKKSSEVPENYNKEDIEVKEENIVIKEDPIVFKEFEETIVIKDEPIECEEKIEETSAVPKDDNKLVLLGSMTVTESGKKDKKKKQKVIDDKKKKKLEQEEINHYRNVNNISVVGQYVAAPIKSFQELNIGADLIQNLTKCGYETPTPIQKQAIPIMLEKRQVLACAPTGSGKTAAFLLPILHYLEGPQRKGFRAVVVCPTRELANQTQRECARLSGERGFRIHVINKMNLALTSIQYGPKSNQKFDILVTTPNRLCFLLNQEPSCISLANVEWLVVDEADKLFEEGLRGFREQLDQIMYACTSPRLHIAMFSATQTVDVSRWCRRHMPGLINVTIGQRNAATDLVEQELLFVGNEGGKLVAFRNLVHKGLHPPVLIFVQSKERAQQLFQELIYDGINVDVIHADRTQLQRDNTVRSFREGKIWVLICTELMARGVDFKGVNLVINYDFPPSAIAYVHRIGRAGRAGRKGKAITFFTQDDTTNLRSIANVLKQSGCEVPPFMMAMKKRSKKVRNKVIDRQDISTKRKYLIAKYEKERDELAAKSTKKKKKFDKNKLNNKNLGTKLNKNKGINNKKIKGNKNKQKSKIDK